MSDSTKYTCVKCDAEVNVQRHADCSNCGEPVPQEVRAKVSPQKADKKDTRKLVTCKCGKVSDLAFTDTCGYCGKPLISGIKEPAANSFTTRTAGNLQEVRTILPTQNDDIQILIKAQNRTTHAVRSLAVFFFMNLMWACIAASLYFLGNLIPLEIHCDGYGSCAKSLNSFAFFLYFLALLTTFVGIVVTIRASMKELLLSRVTSTRM